MAEKIVNMQSVGRAGEKSSTKTVAERPQRRPFRWYKLIVYGGLILFTLTSVGPLIYAFISSFKDFGSILDFPPTLLPRTWAWSNYAQVFGDKDFPRWMFNSFANATMVAVLNVLFSAMAGYALARMNFKGSNLLFILTLSVMMIPVPIIIIPKFIIMNTLHLTDTLFALVLPMMAQPFSVFLMVQFMKGLPRELEESAMLDGASRWRIFWRIILPLVKPALAAVAILSFQGAWNDFLWPLLVLDSRSSYTLPLGLFYYKNAHYTEYNLLLAGSMFNTIPMIILFFIFQRYVIEGATSSAVKG